MFKKTFLVAVLSAASLGALSPLAANAAQYTIVRVAPPAPIEEVVPAARRGFVWAPGHYDYRGNQYSWVRGRWLRERPGHEWREARWVERDGRWHRVGGDWVRRHDERVMGFGHGDERVTHRKPWGARDKDGDGVRNRADRAPNDATRY
jgi:hypothetical protein